MTKNIELHYQGDVFSVSVTDSTFLVHWGGFLVGFGEWNESAQRIEWQDKPRSTNRLCVDSGTLRALEFVILENLRPYCESCCENVKMSGGSYCWPCAQGFRADDETSHYRCEG